MTKAGLVTNHRIPRLTIPKRADLDISGAFGSLYKAMRLTRPIITILGLAILLVTTGDCVNLAFADAKAAECCLMADCPFAGAPQMDSCCKNPASPANYIQGAPQKSLSQPSDTYIDFPSEMFAAPIAEIARSPWGDVTLHAPPGGLKAVATPLLI